MKGSLSLIFWHTAAVCLECVWAFQYWASLNSFSSRLFVCSGLFANGNSKIAWCIHWIPNRLKCAQLQMTTSNSDEKRFKFWPRCPLQILYLSTMIELARSYLTIYKVKVESNWKFFQTKKEQSKKYCFSDTIILQNLLHKNNIDLRFNESKANDHSFEFVAQCINWIKVKVSFTRRVYFHESWSKWLCFHFFNGGYVLTWSSALFFHVQIVSNVEIKTILYQAEEEDEEERKKRQWIPRFVQTTIQFKKFQTIKQQWNHWSSTIF